jgi:hypothetical protein
MMLTTTDRLKMSLKKQALWLLLLIAGLFASVYAAVQLMEVIQ